LVDFTYRLATITDIDEIKELMRVSIQENMKPFLSPAEIEAAKETMGIDLTLIEDETYFVVEALQQGHVIIVGCGGWGKRKTLYGGVHTSGRDDSYSDPVIDAARVRAMYTHPAWVRCGIGTLLLELSEVAARDAGFKTIELGATIPGEPFYLARKYQEYDRNTHTAGDSSKSIVIKMQKKLQ
jgi:GNAT superfamily N-acetyltransferase